MIKYLEKINHIIYGYLFKIWMIILQQLQQPNKNLNILDFLLSNINKTIYFVHQIIQEDVNFIFKM